MSGPSPAAVAEDLRQQTLDARIRRNVIGALGRPPGLFRVAVLPLWGDYYRVNVVADGGEVAHSFFVEAAEDGTLMSTSPGIVRAY
jgi:hypothetical protein